MQSAFLILSCLAVPALLMAQDSTTTCRDSLHVYTGSDDVRYLLWQTGAHTDAAHLLHATGADIEALRRHNPVLQYRSPEPCDLIAVPLDNSRLSPLPAGGVSYPVYYRVRAGETAFHIARRIFDLPVDVLLALNGMDDPALRPEQRLLIGYLNIAGSQPRTQYPVSDVSASNTGFVFIPVERTEAPDRRNYIRDRGVAWWNKEQKDSNLFALHRHAPVNTMIELINPMFNSRVTAKVIGGIPATYPEDISVIVSPGVANALGALDARFHVEMRYAVD